MDLEKAVMAASRLRTELHAAEQYAQHVFNDSGNLTRMKVTTEVVAYANGINRTFTHESFDVAIAFVIEQDFNRLAALALAHMAGEYRRVMVSNKGELEAALAEIKRIEAKEQEPIIPAQAQADTAGAKFEGFAGINV